MKIGWNAPPTFVWNTPPVASWRKWLPGVPRCDEFMYAFLPNRILASYIYIHIYICCIIMYYPLIWLLNKYYVYMYIYIHTKIYKHTQFKILSMFIYDITFIFWTNLSLYRSSHCFFFWKKTQGLRASCSMRIRPRWDPNRGRFPRRWLVVGDVVTWLVDSQGPRFFLFVCFFGWRSCCWLVGWLKKKTCWFKV